MIQPIIYFFEVAKLSVALSLSKLGVNVGELSNVWAFMQPFGFNERGARSTKSLAL